MSKLQGTVPSSPKDSINNGSTERQNQTIDQGGDRLKLLANNWAIDLYKSPIYDKHGYITGYEYKPAPWRMSYYHKCKLNWYRRVDYIKNISKRYAHCHECKEVMPKNIETFLKAFFLNERLRLRRERI